VLEKQQLQKLLNKYLKRNDMAITGVTNVPQDYRTVYNPIEYVATSNQTATSRFKYIFDVYDGATLLARLKVPADPNGYGRCDVHGVCESYLKTDLGTIGGTTGFTGNANSYKEFTIKIGEEYDVAGVLTPDLAQETRTVLTYNGCLPNYRGSYLNFVDYQANNYFQNYTVNANTRKFQTNMPRGVRPFNDDTQKVQLADEGWLYFLYDHSGNPVNKAQIRTYNGTSLVGTFEITNGITADKTLKIPSAPNTLNTVTLSSGVQPVIPTTGVDSYQIQLYDSTPATASEVFYFQIDSECRYTTRRLEFLNSLGGFDCFNFTKVSRMSEQIERKYYKQNAEDMSSGVINYNLSDKQKTQYYTKSKPKMKLTSDWVSAATFNWLLELIESPEVYLHEGSERIAVQGIEGEWQEKRTEVDTVFNLELTIEFGVDNYRQRF
jgi:hypothetical protein